MSPVASPTPPGPLVAIARSLLRAAGDSGVTGLFLVGLCLDPDGGPGGIEVHGLQGPIDQLLLGWHAPPTWAGSVLVRAPATSGVPTALAIDRVEGPIDVDADRARPANLTSWPVDLLRRLLRHPTAPPPMSIPALADRVWLHRVLELVLDHPAPQTIGGDDLARRHPCATSSAPCTWPTFALGLPEPPLALAPRSVDWFDEGAYVRWMLRQLPEPEDVLLTLRALLRPEMAASVARVMSQRAWNRRTGCEAGGGLASLER